MNSSHAFSRHLAVLFKKKAHAQRRSTSLHRNHSSGGQLRGALRSPRNEYDVGTDITKKRYGMSAKVFSDPNGTHVSGSAQWPLARINASFHLKIHSDKQSLLDRRHQRSCESALQYFHCGRHTTPDIQHPLRHRLDRCMGPQCQLEWLRAQLPGRFWLHPLNFHVHRRTN